MAKINNIKILNKITRGQMKDDLPLFRSGDTISVSYKIVEGKKARIQVFTGVCMRIRGHNNSQTFILRKNNGVEKTFPMHSPLIVKIDVTKKGKVRRSYISYLRKRSGKSARIELAD